MTFACILHLLCGDGEVQVMIGSKNETVLKNLNTASKTLYTEQSLQSQITSIVNFISSSANNGDINFGDSDMYDTSRNSPEIISMSILPADAPDNSNLGYSDEENMLNEEVDETVICEKIHSAPEADTEVKKEPLNETVDEPPFDSTSCNANLKTKEEIDRIIFKQRSEDYVTHRTELENCFAYKCVACDLRFKAGYYVKKHVKLQHKDSSMKQLYGCFYCDKTFDIAESLTIHLSVHNPPFQCVDHCTKRFATAENLKKHLYKVNNLISFTCDVCGVSFSRNKDLSVHKRTCIQ